MVHLELRRKRTLHRRTNVDRVLEKKGWPRRVGSAGGALEHRVLRQLAAVGDDDVRRRLAALRTLALDGLDDVQTFDGASEHDVLAIQPLSLDRAQEELRAVRVRTRVRHGEDAGADVLLLEVLVRELLAVDRLATSAVAAREVAALEHEVGNDAVELGALEVKRLALLAHALLARAKAAEVLGRLRHDVVVQLHNDASGRLAADGDIEENLRTTHLRFRLLLSL